MRAMMYDWELGGSGGHMCFEDGVVVGWTPDDSIGWRVRKYHGCAEGRKGCDAMEADMA
ncbi:hypothetical protein SERLADRAFT_474081 [Serpula lacrymans var. lacrymans S7.9]|uniref:Uncharacterized protein n=1 Tax=Serpula lacrymans var. lacrymans (strain S7.9) TaxID=578457 RepID=F8P4N5_SERL9|nr:uncharacterized protein SERLADRAFT_474081 [Serpula lacrymans var. lacrymans S7.9]EGO21572.1 hypothetical protein SERLADRAFT_474081 [Serpula lacrymans var. lacrymans S7.9]